MKATVIIPARFASTRLPGKPLLKQTGKFLIQHVYERAAAAQSIDDVIVATDDRRILEAVESFGGKAIMTRADHPSGTDRAAEAARRTDSDIIVNVQGDEPEIASEAIDRLVALLQSKPECGMATLACPFSKVGQDPNDPNAVKVVASANSRALYFSRANVPHFRDTGGAGTTVEPLLHLGIYAYRRQTLERLASLPPSPLELAERLEQLRALENDIAMAVGIEQTAALGIDTPDDYAAFVQRHAAPTNIQETRT